MCVFQVGNRGKPRRNVRRNNCGIMGPAICDGGANYAILGGSGGGGGGQWQGKGVCFIFWRDAC